MTRQTSVWLLYISNGEANIFGSVPTLVHKPMGGMHKKLCRPSDGDTAKATCLS